MSKRPSLKINAISNWASLLVHIMVGFFLTPFIISHLGQNGYGIWTLVGSFIGYYGLLNLGVGSAITRYIARYSAQNDIKNLNDVANTALAMFCVTGLLAVIISFFVAEPLALFFKVTPEHFIEFKRIVWVLGISTGLSFPSGVLEP
jgi:O-antigen/teichoic acid export membrane protein